MNLVLTKINLPIHVATPIVATLRQKEWYATHYTTIATNVTVLANGTIVTSPPLSFVINPANRYMLQVENQACGSIYEQAVIINPYCEIGFTLSDDLTFCFKEEITAATPPTSGEITVEKNGAPYGTCGSYIFDPGYSISGTGTAAQITLVNAFWKNGAGTCVDATTTDGALNRSGLWATTTTSDQTVGFSRCIDITETKTYYIGIACDNRATINLDGTTIVSQNEAAVNAQFGITGACFKVWSIFPVTMAAGSHVIELIGYNVSSSAALGAEIYDNTPAEIIAATSYGDLNLIFSTKDYIGMAVPIGSGGIGYSCAAGFSLSICDSPIVCKRTIVTNVLY